MVAEKNGTIRFYDLVTHQAILSLTTDQTPLMSVHWCLKNTFKVGAVAGNDWFIWDISRSRYCHQKHSLLLIFMAIFLITNSLGLLFSTLQRKLDVFLASICRSAWHVGHSWSTQLLNMYKIVFPWSLCFLLLPSPPFTNNCTKLILIQSNTEMRTNARKKKN